MNAFTVEVENKPGEIARVTKPLADAGINIVPYCLGAGGQFVVAFVASDEDGARKTLADAGITYREISLIVVRMEDRPGQTNTASRKLADAGVNIELWLPVDTSRDNFTVAIAVDKQDAAREALGDQVTTWTYS